MKILHVETGKNLYGGALQVLYLLRGLQSKKCENVLVCPVRSTISKVAKPYVDKTYAIPMRGDLDFLFIFRLWKILYKEKPDIVHLHSRRGADILGGIASQLAGIKTVLTRRVDNPELKLFASIKYRLYDEIVTISDGIKRVLVSEGISPAKLQCIHSAVDTVEYKPGCVRSILKTKLGYDEDCQYVGIIAQLIERKGHRYLFEALPEILSNFPRVRLIVFGQGPLEQSLHQLCSDLNIAQQVFFAGFRKDLHELLPCLDLVIHPAEMEGLGVSLLQAASCGVPIVAAPVGGIPEIVKDGVNGYLVEPKNARAIAIRAMEILGDEQKSKSMGVAGRQLVEQEFSIDSMVNGNYAAYQKLIVQ